MDDRMELAGLAHRRYPDVELPLAIRFLESDRRRAGLGALDERRRKVGGNISNYKRDVYEQMQVRYHLVRHTPARMEYPRMSWDEWMPTLGNAAEAKITLIQVPARDQHLCVPADYRDLREQSGRRKIAATLREARRQLARPSP